MGKGKKEERGTLGHGVKGLPAKRKKPPEE